jgi:hypothetical protein
MIPDCKHWQREDSMAIRCIIQIITIGICSLALTGQLFAVNKPIETPNYSQLLDYIQKEDLSDPLMVFGGIEENFDRQLNLENIAYINANSDLLQQIQSHLSGDHLKWKLKTSFKQLWVVPENRDEYAQLFERYCHDAVAYLLERINRPNPYNAISTLKGPLPDLNRLNTDGITAYLVHNIADEYTEEYLFFDAENDQSQVKIKLSNREFSGKIGSVTSKLKIGEDNQFEFIREPYTLWQNSAKNPYNVLIVPIEETLHIILRSATEQAMHEDLTSLKPEKLHEVNKLIDHWMAVEEAVVGGLVWRIMPELLAHVAQGISGLSLEQTKKERHAHDQYQYLDRGIDLVNRMGVDETMNLYQNSPQKFKTKLIDASPKIESAKIAQTQLLVN